MFVFIPGLQIWASSIQSLNEDEVDPWRQEKCSLNVDIIQKEQQDFPQNGQGAQNISWKWPSISPQNVQQDILGMISGYSLRMAS